MAKVQIVNIEPRGGETVTVQVDGFADEILTPGEETTVHIDAENEAVISVND